MKSTHIAQITKKNANVVINKNLQNSKHFEIDLAHFYLVNNGTEYIFGYTKL